MITLFAILYMLSDEPREHSLELTLATFQTREECLRYMNGEEFEDRWQVIERKMPRYTVTFGCTSDD
jgi:hypothetical protein